MLIDQAVVEWTGFPGAPGYSTFYAVPGSDVAFSLAAFFENMKTWLPQNVKIQVPTSGDTLEDTTGIIESSWSTAAIPLVTGTNTQAYAAPAGIHYNWITNDFINGRRVRGKTFIVPMSSACFDNDGSLTSTIVTQVGTVGDLFMTAVEDNLLIYHRPAKGTHAGGKACRVVGYNFRDRASVLTSRRPGN